MHSKPLHTLLLAVGWLVVVTATHAQIVTYTWIAAGGATDDNYTNTANWVGGTVPLNDGNARLNFPVANGPELVTLPGGNLTLNSLYFDASYPGVSYRFGSVGATTLTFAPVANSYGQNSNNSGYSRTITFDAGITLDFATDQYWTAQYVTINGAAGGAGRVRFAPHSYYASDFLNTGNLVLNGPGNFTGGLETNNVRLYLNHVSAAAGGPLFMTDTTIYAEPGYVLNNAIQVSGAFQSGSGPLTLTGPITLGGVTGMGGSLVVTGNIGELTPGTQLNITQGTVRLSGTNTYTGETVVEGANRATLLFETAASVPTAGQIRAETNAYAGVAFTGGVQSSFINRLNNEQFTGTIGFDSLGATQTFAEDIDLTSLVGPLGLGTTTSAILTGTIWTAGDGTDNYRFGNGGGTLTVASNLTDNVGVNVTSTSYWTPTTIVLQGNNTFSGDVQVESGVVIFDSANALPGGATVTLDQRTGSHGFAYAGVTENSSLSPQDLLGRLDFQTDEHVLGVDSSNPNAPRTLADAINLTGALGDLADDENLFIGTATGATLTGTLTSGTRALGLVGLKGKQLTVDSLLTDATVGGLLIGLVDAPVGIRGAVRLNGANTFSGGTLWQTGDLVLGHASALGTGRLVVGEYASGLSYTGDFTVANDFRFENYESVALSTAGSTANLTLTGKMGHSSYFGSGFDYRGAGTLTYAGTAPEIGWLSIDAAPGGGVVFNRPNGQADGVNLANGSLTIAGSTDIKLLETTVGTTVQVAAGANLGLLYNTYGEGPIAHLIGGTIGGAGSLSVEDIDAALVGANTYTGGTTLDAGGVGFTQGSALGTGAVTVTANGGGLTALAPDLVLANAITLGGELELSGGTYFGYQGYNAPGNRNFTLSGIISGPGSLTKDSDNTVTVSGANTFSGGVKISQGTMIFSHDQAAGTGLLDLGTYAGGTAIFTTAAPSIGGLRADEATGAVQLAANSTLTVNQPQDATYRGSIAGSGARLNKGGPGYLTLEGGAYTYTGGTGITAGGVIFSDDSAIATNPANGISVAAGAYAGLGWSAETTWSAFVGKIDPLSQGTLGVDGDFNATETIDLTGFAPGLRLGSATFGTLAPSAVITPNGDYLFGGGGGTLEVKSTLTDALKSVDVTSPAGQPLTLWLRNNNYFGGPLTATNSAVVFDAHALDFVSGLQLGAGGYLGSADPQLAPAAFLAKLAPGTNTGAVGFDGFGYNGRVVGGAIDLGAFGSGLYLGTATTATLRGPITLPGGAPAYRFAAYKGAMLTVDTNLGGSQGVVIGDPDSFGTMRHPHNEQQLSAVILTGLNSYTGGTVLNAGRLSAGPHSLGTGALTVQPNSFPATEDPVNNLPRFEPLEYGGTFANQVVLNGALALGGGTRTTLAGTISGPGALWLDRYDYLPLSLTGANTYTGGTVLRNGTLGLGHNSALGTGTVTVYRNAALLAEGGARTLANPISVVQDDDDDYAQLRVAGDHSLTLNGPVTFAPGYAEITPASSLPYLPLVRFNGGLSGDTELAFNLGGANGTTVWIAGTNTYTGGTTVNSGRVIFDSVASLPTAGALRSGYGGYLGLATPTAGLQTAFINRFSGDYNQVIGFDSPNAAAPQTFAADIDLGGINTPYLSSATAAILAGTITPYDDSYLFSGSGGGVLTVASALTGNRNVRLEYNQAPLLVRLSGANSYTGTTQANGLGLIFATAAALPAGQHFEPNASVGSYFGYEDPAISVGGFLSRFNPLAAHTIVGFDSVDVNAPRTITSPDLSYFTQNPTDIFIGTATSAIIDGTITWPAFNSGYNFAAYRTGRLTVNSVLGGSGPVRIGNERLLWSVQGVDGTVPTVELAANNTYTGGTHFYGGELVLSHANALGTGTLNAKSAYYYYEETTRRLLLNTPAIANNIFLESYAVDLRLATTQAVGTLSGQISGSGNLIKDGANTIRLTGTNTFVGDLHVEQGVLEFANAAAVGGSTDNRLFFREAGGTAHFSAGNPVIGALLSEPGINATVQIDGGVNLALGAHNSGFSYQTNDYYGAITGAGSLTKDGHATVALHGANTYTGGTTITQGVLLADNASALGTGTITLNGGELVFGRGVTIPNPISFGASGGLLSGASTFTGPVVLGAQAGLSPGQSPGTMTFASDLTLAGASFLDFEIQDPTGVAGAGYDTLVVGGTLFVTANPGTPFVINIMSLDAGNSVGQLQLSNPNASYSLLVVSANAISGFAPENFTLNTANFSTNWGNEFSFSLVQSGNQLLLNFSPVPEPSTYALLGLGGLLAGLARWRGRFTRRD